MNVLIFQHTPGENPGAFLEHISSNGDTARIVRLYDRQPVPDLANFNLLLVLGGPMDVWETETHPWLIAEKQAIKTWVRDLKRPYFGICLGHQLLVDALGGRCAPMVQPEIGVLPVDLHINAQCDPLFGSFPGQFEVLQWHGVEAIELPPGSAVLAQSAGCAIQALRVSDCAWGVQFHPELVQGTIKSWMNDPANHQCAVNWLRSTDAAHTMSMESDKIADDQFRMTSEIYANLRQI
ncbi:type 1 glutamine amidotransferase [Ruegeria sp. EL01]|jgi:GMP synthase-like glutamine amidotransferase|uniref:type 1 glutamine amidotransferase n=1 Tax=Ruegeria sp. EL01 TaxID=2107578 RepID=UPI000EA80621|nr:type 1 glutamine amidotransferase [Ruegeria sp. EL01]